MPEDDAQGHVNGTAEPNPAPTVTDNAHPTPKHSRTGTDPDAQEMVISSLRSQIQDLFSQVNELNNKLVKSYDRVSDLEDDIHVASANLRTSSIRISQLELERTQHLAALNTGLLVEKAHVTAELNRLMEKATEEAAHRGQAENARKDIEKDLDDLSATLFDQANTMVAEARYAQHLSERKVDDAERALKGAEEMVGLMQVQMQALQSDKEEAEDKMKEMEIVMGKGKWHERPPTIDFSKPLKLLSSHSPYQEFLLFVAHLRSIHQSSSTPPAMATLLPLPFLARLSTEDSEPTVRLDLAPALNWLSRRSVLAAINNGQLTIEPIPVSALFSESTLYSSPTTVAGISPNNDCVSCALCGADIAVATEHAQHRRRPPSFPNGGRGSWSGSFFKKTSSLSNSSHPPSPTNSVTALPISHASSQSESQQVYIFRVAALPTASSISSTLPIPSIAKSLSQGSSSPASPSPVASSPNNQPMTLYPLCSSGWCLRRLRAACTLWSFVRTGVVEKVWEEEIPFVPPPSIPTSTNAEKPPLPPRKRGLWGIATAIGERAASWGDSDKDKSKKSTPASSPPSMSPSASTQPSSIPPLLPPRRDSVAVQRRLPPPPPPKAEVAATPPPLPKRNQGRNRVPTVEDDGDDVTVPASQPSTPTRVVFDAGAPPSPMPPKARDLPPAEEDLHAPNGNPVSETTAPAAAIHPPRSDTPSSIPLPESRPTSPPTNVVAGNKIEPPARIDSPVLVSGAANGGTATPPPLPRRAAARRPVPPIAGGVNGGMASGPATPTRATSGEGSGSLLVSQSRTTVAEEKPEAQLDAKEEGGEEVKVPSAEVEAAEKVEVEDKSEKVLEAETKAEEGTAEKKEQELDTQRIVVSPLSTPTSEDEEEFVDAPTATPAVESSEPLLSVPEKTETASTTIVATVTETTTTTTTEVLEKDKKTGKRESSDDTVLANSDIGHHDDFDDVLNAETHPAEFPIHEDPHDEEHDPTFKEVLIGDATWEERTWKEITKLKEDMFWARIGGWR